jgi:transposase-like protein
LRREGLYSSHLTYWRRQAHLGTLQALSPKKRGPRKQKPNPLTQKIVQLEKEKLRLSAKLKQAETIIEVQKKISELLEIPLNHNAGENS